MTSKILSATGRADSLVKGKTTQSFLVRVCARAISEDDCYLTLGVLSEFCQFTDKIAHHYLFVSFDGDFCIKTLSSLKHFANISAAIKGAILVYKRHNLCRQKI